ncbi:hypothetical protein AVEN_254843-1 [Araneus ventricosus]|uniref:Uncharacterized protein n=1 Tax=Araneus ventricosus TaxID=182803 RepID=A0A4Y2V5T0_ARAVE|nr:hypothetical protein AVEN_254843-1 [Araneus ventricosus]
MLPMLVFKVFYYYNLSLLLHPDLKQQEGKFGISPTILKRSRMTRTASCLAPFSPGFLSTVVGGVWPYALASGGPTCEADFRRNRISSPEPLDPEVWTLPLGHLYPITAIGIRY